MGIIYCYTNLTNGKKYIGQSICPEERQRNHKSQAFNEKSSEYNAPFHRAIRKYGWNGFEYEILAEANDIETLNQIEILLIEKYNTQIPNGYNIEAGGKNAPKPKTLEHKKALTWSQAELSEEEIIELRKAYMRKESPKQIYEKQFKDRLAYSSFLNIWSGRRYKNIMPEAIEKGRHTKLTQEIVNQIREDYVSLKLSYVKLAEKYNVSKSTIADIISKKTWKS